MKKFKRAAALFVATLMAGSLASFTACGNGDNKKVDKFLDAMLSQKVEHVGMETNTVTTRADGSPSNMTQTAQMNVKTGDADIVTQVKDGDTLVSWQNHFLRDWNIFTYDQADGEAASWNGVTLTYKGNVLTQTANKIDGMTSWAGYLTGTVLSAGSVDAGAGNYAIAKFAHAFGGLTVAEDTASIDLNKTFYRAAQELKTALHSINEKTTLGNFLKTEEMRNLFSPFTEMMTPAELKGTIVALINAVTESSPEIQQLFLLMGLDFDALFPTPTKNISTYDYLLKVISSEAMKNTINSIVVWARVLQGQQSLTPALSTTLDKVKLSDLFALAGVQISDVVAIFDHLTKNMTEENFALVTPDAEISLTNMTIVYTLSEGTVAQQDITIDCAVTEEDSAVTVCLNEKIVYPAEAYTLADISACKTEELTLRYTDGEKLDLPYLSELGYTLSQKVTDNQVVGFVLADSQEGTKNIGANVPFTIYGANTSYSLLIELDGDDVQLFLEDGDGYEQVDECCLIGDRGVIHNTVGGILQGKAGTFVPVE